MLDGSGMLKVGAVKVATTDGRGFTPEEWAEACMRHIIHVGDDANPLLRDQALAYREQVKAVITLYMTKAIQSDRTTLFNLLANQGHKDMADILSKQL